MQAFSGGLPLNEAEGGKGMFQEIDGERYYTIREAAVLLRRHWRTVWEWTVERKVEFHQPGPGCKILIPQHEIIRLSKIITNP
jgi:excisionase family DNA binding protein